MKFVSFSTAGAGSQLGVLTQNDSQIVTIPAIPDLVTLIESGKGALKAVATQLARPDATPIPVESVTLEAPILPRRNIFCVGKNYHAHAEEFHKSGYDSSAGTAAAPSAPIIFTKAPSSVIATGVPVPAYLDETNTTDYEGELGVVIGTGGRGICAADAMAHVFGYTVINDVTARDLQQAHRQWFLGKSIDGYCPLGPAVVTADEVGDIRDRSLRTIINGEIRQNSPISNLIFDIPTLIETISKRITLLPGDVFATGTPEGVGIGFKPPRFLVDGDVMRVEIDGVGVIENVVAGVA